MLVMDDRVVLPGWRVDGDAVLTVPCPPGMTAAARSFLADATGTAAPSRPAATVMLLRPGRRRQPRRDVEVFMLRRSPAMAFAPDALVFPGGRVDAGDGQRPPWDGPRPGQWATWLGGSADEAAAVVTAAVRELFEETGVLLAGDRLGRHVAAIDDATWTEDRDRLASHRAGLAEVLSERGLVLRSDLLGVRARWITPEFEPRRYDTYFFTALVPPGQRADGRTTEAVAHRWVRPASVLHSAALGQVTLLPPTACSLAQLLDCDSPARFAADRLLVTGTMLAPTVQHDGTVTMSCQLPASLGIDALGRPQQIQKEVTK